MKDELLMIFSKIDDKKLESKKQETVALENYLIPQDENKNSEIKINSPVYKIKNYKSLKERILDNLSEGFSKTSKNYELKEEQKMMAGFLNPKLQYEYLEERLLNKKLSSLAKEVIKKSRLIKN
jgi:hypothetical protein